MGNHTVGSHTEEDLAVGLSIGGEELLKVISVKLIVIVHVNSKTNEFGLSVKSDTVNQNDFHWDRSEGLNSWINLVVSVEENLNKGSLGGQ